MGRRSTIAGSDGKKRWRLTWLLSTGAATAALIAQSAHAQSAPAAPVRTAIDAARVDLFNGTLDVDMPAITLGSGNSVASYHAWNYGSGFSDNTQGFLNLVGSVMTVSIGETSDSFTVSGTNYTATEGNGATLVNNTSTATYTYTAHDGTIAHFGYPSLYAWRPYGNSGFLTDITKPNGEKITYSYGLLTYCKTWKPGPHGDFCIVKANAYRLSSITSSYGYRFNPTYSYDYTYDPSAPGDQPNLVLWAEPSGINVYNLANSQGAVLASQTFAITTIGNYNYYVVTDTMGHVYKYRLGGSGVTGVTMPSSSVESVTATYNAQNKVASVANAAGTTIYASNDAGNVRTVTVTDALSHVSTYVFDIPSARMTSSTDPLSNKTSMQYDGYGRTIAVTRPEGNYSQIAYDARGNVTQQTNVAKPGSGLANVATTANYDTSCTITVKCNKPNWTKDALGNETDYTYDPTHGGVLTATAPADPNGIRPQVRYAYTAIQAYYLNATGSIAASGQNTYMLTGISACRTNASCVGTSDETKATINYGPQVAGTANSLYPLSETVAAGDGTLSASSSSTYDAFGNVAMKVGPLGSGQTTVYYYDADRRALGSVGPVPGGIGSPAPTAVKHTYNADGALTETQVGSVPDQSANSWANSFTEAYHAITTLDTYDRPIRQATVSGSTNYAISDQLYDSVGRSYCTIQYMNLASVGGQATSCAPTQTTGASGPDRVTQTGYDNDDREIVEYQGVGTSAYSYDQTGYTANGEISAVVDGMNNRTTYTYDGFDRLSVTNFPMAAQGSNAGDPNNFEQLTYDADSNILQKRLRDGISLISTFDNLGRLRTLNHNDNAATVTYSYNLLNQLTTSLRAIDNNQVTNIYDALGRRISEAQPYGAMSYQYDAAGDPTRLTWADGFYVNYIYDNTGNVSLIEENGATSGVGLLAQYSYDGLGRRINVAYGNGTSRAYAFDLVSRLASIQLTFPNAAGYNDTIGPFTYNPASQIASLTKSNDNFAWPGHVPLTRPYITNGLNQYTTSGGVALQYDGRGNLNVSGTATYSYDGLNRLYGTNGGVTIGYDPAQNRVDAYTVNSASTYLYYAGSALTAETNGTSITQRYVPGPGTDEPIVWYSGGTTAGRQFLQADERGSIIAVTNSAGAITGHNSYDEFGIPASSNIGRFQYTGQTWFPEVGLYYYKARWYSPTLGRFMQSDPIGYGDGLNFYNYAHSDPVNGIDPTGLSCDHLHVNCNQPQVGGDDEIDVFGHRDSSGAGGGYGLTFSGGGSSGGGGGGGNSGSNPRPPKPGPKPKGKQTSCGTVLRNGQTVGQVVRNAVQNILADAGASDLSPDLTQFGAFVATVQSHGPIDFKYNMGPDKTGTLGAAGNFAYGAIASGVGYSQGFAEFGAGVYAAAKSKSNFNNPFGEDNSAAANLGAGYATEGCTK